MDLLTDSSMKQTFLIHFVALLCICSLAQSDSTKYSFFVAGHAYGKPGVNKKGFHLPFKDKFNYIQNRTEIKFGILTGDIFLYSLQLRIGMRLMQILIAWDYLFISLLEIMIWKTDLFLKVDTTVPMIILFMKMIYLLFWTQILAVGIFQAIN